MEIKKNICEVIFREYDIRGEYKVQLDEDDAYLIGLAVGTKLKSLKRINCVVGHDNRLSGESLTDALIKGIRNTGINVKYLGLVTTPMYYFACLYLKIDSGVMVTASHNPVGDNGFKIALENYDNACGEKIKELYNIIKSENFASGSGTLTTFDIREYYIKEILKGINLKKRLKVVIDPANATGSIIIKDIFDKINAECVYINDISDGSFPHHHPDPSVIENMRELESTVKSTKSDIGIALDGDADRVGIVDELGHTIPIDILMAIFWDDIMPKVDNKIALFDVKCSKALEDEIIRLGGTPYIYRTGNAYQKNKIKELDLVFGGELSGHLFFRDKWQGFDDGIYAGLRLMEILSNSNKPLSKLYDHLNKYYSTREEYIPIEESKKFKIVDDVRKYTEDNNIKAITIDGVRATYDDAWALVRASNTGPNLTVRFEANSLERLQEIKDEYMNLIENLKNR